MCALNNDPIMIAEFDFTFADRKTYSANYCKKYGNTSHLQYCQMPTKLHVQYCYCCCNNFY